MATLLRAASRRSPKVRISVREVCLIGMASPPTEGERLSWSGRTYRIESVQAASGYVHLAEETESG